MANCSFGNSTVINTGLMRFVLAVLSLVMCVVAIAILIHYKLYRSFNYRLLLYLLISFLIHSIASNLDTPLQLVLIWYHSNTATQQYSHLCKAVMVPVRCLEFYSAWNTQLSIVFMIAEIFSMIIFSIQLQKAEVPLIIACFILPIIAVPLQLLICGKDDFSSCPITPINNDTTTYTSINISQCYILPGMIIMSICAVAVAIAMSCLAYRILRWHFIARNNAEQYLLHKLASKRYQNALKESLPLSVYPITMQLILLMYYLDLIHCTTEAFYIFFFTLGSTGSIASTIFFIHVKALGQHRRNKFRNKCHIEVPSNSAEQINEGQTLTTIGSITATHVTDFDPLSESDIEPNTQPV